MVEESMPPAIATAIGCRLSPPTPIPSATGTLSKPGIQTRLLAYRTEGCKYIRTEGYRPDESEVLLSEEVYDLKDDPAETLNLNETQIKEKLKFKQEAINHLSQFKKDKKEQATSIERERIKSKAKKISMRTLNK